MLRQSKRDHLKKMSSQGSKQFWKTKISEENLQSNPYSKERFRGDLLKC